MLIFKLNYQFEIALEVLKKFTYNLSFISRNLFIRYILVSTQELDRVAPLIADFPTICKARGEEGDSFTESIYHNCFCRALLGSDKTSPTRVAPSHNSFQLKQKNILQKFKKCDDTLYLIEYNNVLYIINQHFLSLSFGLGHHVCLGSSGDANVSSPAII